MFALISKNSPQRKFNPHYLLRVCLRLLETDDLAKGYISPETHNKRLVNVLVDGAPHFAKINQTFDNDNIYRMSYTKFSEVVESNTNTTLL